MRGEGGVGVRSHCDLHWAFTHRSGKDWLASRASWHSKSLHDHRSKSERERPRLIMRLPCINTLYSR
eukprot:COSAG03_NODE_2200_length_3015_cov_192.787037_3_plen_67_part_00